MFGAEAAAGLVFLVVYISIFLFLARIFCTREASLLSRWVLLLLHAVIRIAALSCGVAAAATRPKSVSNPLLAAYLMKLQALSAEGYFVLIFTGYHFLAVWEKNRRDFSSLDPRLPAAVQGWPRLKLALQSGPMPLIQFFLFNSNSSLILSGTPMEGSQFGADNPKLNNIRVGRILAAVGFSVFIACVQAFAYLGFRRYQRGPKDLALKLILAIHPFLTIRGVFGLLQYVTQEFNRLNSTHYSGAQLDRGFLAREHFLITLPELIGCCLLLATWWVPREREPERRMEELRDRKEDGGDVGGEDIELPPTREAARKTSV